ncbi:alkanesulfonate monooxygenase [Sinosporangium album]|uniref:Alkanesulfonate monooxygenase n=1 Tax=Sinosporangium album TaxID=504805 RepID=A0A1G7T5K6_9ACTN|nr:LLM class flavin-dependent oxidoreductase [Sinosporangium album]SDG30511.1 alkanesulfonate monooxygenase [Sinosporangium album]
MAREVLWYIVPRDGEIPWEPKGRREVDLDHLRGLAATVDRLGYSGALLATDLHDVWVLGSALASVTDRLRPLLAVHPGLISPTLLAKMALTFDHLYGGRLQINVVNGDTRTLRQYGLHVDHDERYDLSAEYWGIVKRLTAGERVSFEGRYFTIEDAALELPPVQRPHVPLWFGGSSAAGLRMAAEHIDVYLSWGEPPKQLAEKIRALRRAAEEFGREIRFGVRLHLIVRDTEKEAWGWADHLLRSTSPETYARMSGINLAADSEGMRRQFGHHGGRVPDRAKDLEISPNLWPGMSLFRPGPGTALVGSTENVLERLHELEELGVDTFILSGNPLAEEAERVAETILPSLLAGQPV